MEQLFDYCNSHNLNNDFIISLETQYKKNNKLSDKQIECLEKNVNRHKKITELFNSLEAENSFIISLRNQFNEKGFLSIKQYEALTKY